jgi:hypothetical protein
MDMHQKDTAEAIWASLVPYRDSLEHSWKECAKLTLPYVFKEENLDESTFLPTPYNSVGPSGVNTLASKLLLALLPTTGSFFRLLPHAEAMEGMTADDKTLVDKELSELEQDIVELVSKQALRVPIYEALKMLIITGNVMVYKVPGGTFKVFSPHQYVVERDYVGNVLRMVIKEKMSYAVLPEKVQKIIDDKSPNSEKTEDIDIYTVIKRVEAEKYDVYQEVADTVIDGTLTSYNKNLLPYIPLRWTQVLDHDYGIGLVQQYLGDLRSLEGLSQLIVEGSSVMAKTIFGLRPASTTKIEDLSNALNGDFVAGDLERDVTTLQVGKASDFSIPFQLMQSLEQRIGRAFLNFSSSVRDSERTTAVEVRQTVKQLDEALGGTFAVLALELQLPLIRIMLDEVEPKALTVTEPSIVTGASAISRERDFQNLSVMLQSIAALGPEVISQYLKVEGYFTQVANALGIDPNAIVRSQDEIAQVQAQQQAAAGGQPQAVQQPTQ